MHFLKTASSPIAISTILFSIFYCVSCTTTVTTQNLNQIITDDSYSLCSASLSDDVSSIYWVALNKATLTPLNQPSCIQQCGANPLFKVLGLFDSTMILTRLISTPEPHYSVYIEISLANCNGWQTNDYFSILIDNVEFTQWSYNTSLQTIIMQTPHSADSFQLLISHSFASVVTWGIRSLFVSMEECTYDLSTMDCVCPSNYYPVNGECLECSSVDGMIENSSTKECQEVCGDGKRVTNYFECDDGNTIDGDGCSSSCAVEPSFKCSGGSATTPDYCVNIAPIKITLSTTNQSNGPQITITFNKNVRIEGSWSDVFSMEIVDDNQNQVTYPTENGPASTFTATITATASIYNKVFKLVLKQPSKIIDDKANTKIYQTEFEIDLIDYTFITNAQRQTSQQFSEAADSISTGMILTFIPLLVSGNFFLLANAIEITEMIFHYQYINVKYPFNVNAFFAVFNNFQLPMVPNIFEFFYDPNILGDVPQRLKDINIDSFFMRNSGQSFTILFIVIFIHLICKTLSFGWNRWSRLRKGCQEILGNQLKYAWYFDTVTTIYLNLAVSAFTQLYDTSTNNNDITLIINMALTLLTILLVCIWPFFAAYYIYSRKDTLHDPEVMEKLSSLAEGLKTDKLIQSLFQVFVFSRKLYLALVVNFLINSTHVQMTCLSILNIVFVCLRVTHLPQRIRFQEFVNVITEILLFITQIAIQQMKDDEDSATEESRISSGWSIIACSALIMVLHASFIGYETIGILVNYLKNRAAQKRKRLLVAPELTPLSKQSNEILTGEPQRKETGNSDEKAVAAVAEVEAADSVQHIPSQFIKEDYGESNQFQEKAKSSSISNIPQNSEIHKFKGGELQSMVFSGIGNEDNLLSKREGEDSQLIGGIQSQVNLVRGRYDLQSARSRSQVELIDASSNNNSQFLSNRNVGLPSSVRLVSTNNFNSKRFKEDD